MSPLPFSAGIAKQQENLSLFLTFAAFFSCITIAIGVLLAPQSIPSVIQHE